ncbi:hypothetical protein FACS189450_15250 [Spirochaetia bacterium]|nr:hypothetical protein FACS189450_15250 [Spirochaetia bacterium]
MVTFERFKGNDIICLWESGEKENERSFSFGKKKAQLIVANLPLISNGIVKGGDIVLRRDANDKFPFVFPYDKGILIMENLDEIKKFAAKESKEDRDVRNYVEEGLGNRG